MDTAAAIPPGPQCAVTARDGHAHPLRDYELDRVLCGHCERRIRTWLAELPTQMVVLAASLVRDTAPGMYVTASRTAPIPPRLDVLNLLAAPAPGDVHDEHGDQCGPVPITATLGSWCRLIAEERGLAGPRHATVAGLIQYLDAHLDWACGQPWAGELHTELRVLIGAVRGITYVRPRSRPVPRPCPTCDQLTLVETDWQEYVECQDCGGLWTVGELNEDAGRRRAAA